MFLAAASQPMLGQPLPAEESVQGWVSLPSNCGGYVKLKTPCPQDYFWSWSWSWKGGGIAGSGLPGACR